MNILFLANLIPYPQDGGGKIFTNSTIQALSKNNNIDMMCFYEHEDIEKGKKVLSQYCQSIKVFPIRVTTKENMKMMVKKAAGSLFSSLPLAVSKYYSREMADYVRKMLKVKNYDCVFINILAMCVYLDDIRKQAPDVPIVLYEQNCEAMIYKRLYEQESGFLKRCFIGTEYKKLNRFEQKTLKSVDSVIVLSEEDKKNLGLTDCAVIPIGVQPPSYKKKYGEEKREKLKMLFIGTMTWAPNNEGIIWFLENVMPLCAQPDFYELTIVGKNPSDTVTQLAYKYSNVKVLGYVESLEDIYEQSDILIVPLFVGSGQRVKIIEAFSKGFAVVSTTVGAEGLSYIDNETILIANTAEEYKKAVDMCFDGKLLKKIGEGGKKVFETEYSTDVIAERINEIINQRR